MQHHKKMHHNKATPGEKVILNRKPNPNSNEEGPLPEGERKCDQCNYENKNSVLLQAHKLKRHMKDNYQKCKICGGIFSNQGSLDKHMKQHKAKLDVGRTSYYPMNVYTFISQACKASFKTQDDLMDHMCSVHLSEKNRVAKWVKSS